jgi:hypothetical protein
MPDLYIANASPQKVEFYYRLRGTPAARYQPIPIGGQVKISGELSDLDIKDIIDQHARYGFVPAHEAHKVAGNFGGLVYSIGTPVAVSKIMDAASVRLEKLKKEGEIIRKEAAVSLSNQMETELGETATLNSLAISIQEEDRRLIGDEAPTGRLSEGFLVSRQAEANQAPRRGRPPKR